MNRFSVAPFFIWGIASLLSLFSFLFQGYPSIIISNLIQEYQIDLVQIGLLTASYHFTYLFFQVPAGLLLDHFGPKKVLCIGSSICIFTIIFFALSHLLWQGQLSRIMMGAAASPTFLSALCLASRHFAPALFTLFVALTEFVTISGEVVGKGILSKSVLLLGWRSTTLLLASIIFLLTAFAFFIIRDYPKGQEIPKKAMKAKDALAVMKKNLFEVCKKKQIWLSGVYAGLTFSIFLAFAGLWAVPYFMTKHQLKLDAAGKMGATFFMGACIGTLVLAFFATKIKKHRPFMSLGSLLSLLLLLALLYLPSLSILLTFVLAFALGFFCCSYAFSYALVGKEVPSEMKGIALGVTNMLCLSVGLLLQTLTAEIYEIAFLPFPILLLLAFLIIFWIKEPIYALQVSEDRKDNF
ncbi:MAG: MFS transporter [Simkania negevensis]|nr:MFS transporter [Simkania negevensis]